MLLGSDRLKEWLIHKLLIFVFNLQYSSFFFSLDQCSMLYIDHSWRLVRVLGGFLVVNKHGTITSTLLFMGVPFSFWLRSQLTYSASSSDFLLLVNIWSRFCFMLFNLSSMDAACSFQTIMLIM